MKRKIFIAALLLIGLTVLSAQSGRPVTIGIHLLAGGRYDDVRMCVSTPKGVKGGPIGEIYLDIGIPVRDRETLTINIPVMRPILFAAAFRMLQFEPQITYEYTIPQVFGGNTSLVLGGGLGIVFHYGPDYNSSQNDRGPSFFAMGPLFTGSAGLMLEGSTGTWIPGIKAFYAPLFSPSYRTGQVAGGGLELHYRF